MRTVSADLRVSSRFSRCGAPPGRCEEVIRRLVQMRNSVPFCHGGDNPRIVSADRYTGRDARGRLIRSRFLSAMARCALLAVGLIALKRAVRGCYWMPQNAKHDDECSSR